MFKDCGASKCTTILPYNRFSSSEKVVWRCVMPAMLSIHGFGGVCSKYWKRRRQLNNVFSFQHVSKSIISIEPFLVNRNVTIRKIDVQVFDSATSLYDCQGIFIGPKLIRSPPTAAGADEINTRRNSITILEMGRLKLCNDSRGNEE